MSNNDDPNTVGQSNNNDPNTVGQGSPSTTGSSGLADAGCHIEICRESFVSWTNGVPLDVDLMSEAGWRYIGDGKVQSCCCKITLKWEVSYDPWTQHAIHRPNCMFLKRQKDQAFIDGVQAAIPLNEEIDPVLDESEADLRPDQSTPPPASPMPTGARSKRIDFAKYIWDSTTLPICNTMSDSAISTPYVSFESLETDNDSVPVVDDLRAAACNEHKGDNSHVCSEDNNLYGTEANKNSGAPQSVDVRRNTNSPNLTLPRNTNSPNANISRNTNSNGNIPQNTNSNGDIPRNTNSNGSIPRNANSSNGHGAEANPSNSSQASANAAANNGPNVSRQNHLGKAKHPEFADEPKRRGTFRNWPARLQQSPEMMSGAGFFFSLNGDSVRCFVCGIGLRNWDKDDNPWVEHARWSPKCPYVLEKKGPSFVDLVQEAVRNAELQQALRENNERHWNGNNAGGYQAEVHTEADRANPQSDLVRSQGPGAPDQFPSDAERKNPLLCDAAQSVLNMGYLPRVVKQCLDEFLKLEGWHSMSGKKLMKMIMDKEEVGDLDPNFSVVPSQRPPKKVSLEELSVPKSQLERENTTLKERMLCKICLQTTVTIVFLPCGHLVSCAQCAPALQKCPVCRGPMKATVRVSFG